MGGRNILRFLINNFMNAQDAKKLMSFFDANAHMCYDERPHHKERNIHYDHIPDPAIKKFLDYYEQKNIFFIDHYFKTKTVPWHEPRLCRWKKGHSMDLHVDKNNNLQDLMDYSSLVYLNDDYEGGELFFENETFKMDALSCIIFESGPRNKHGVKTITKGKRYSIPSWYQKI